MKFAAALIVLLGLTCASALEQFKYRYHGQALTGIPMINSDVSGTAIQGDLIVKYLRPTQFVFQLKNVQVGQYQGQTDLWLRRSLPVSWSPLQGEGKLLEKPWSADISQVSDKMHVPKEEQREWITNIRKSIVNSFIPIVRRSMQEGASQHMEETLFGICQSQYTLVKAPSSLCSEVSGQQGGAASGGQCWRLRRSINFDKCQDNVRLQHTALANGTYIGSGQSDYVQSRSSVIEIIVQGQPGQFVIRRSIAEGDFTLSPYAMETREKIRTVSNQTLLFQGPSTESIPFQPQNCRGVQTLKQAVASPYSEGSWGKRNWVNFRRNGTQDTPYNAEQVATGIWIPQSMEQNLVGKMESFLEKAAQQIAKLTETPQEPISHLGSSAGNSVLYLEEISRIIQMLPKPLLKQVVDKVFQGGSDRMKQIQMMLVTDVLARSGSGPAIQILIDLIKTQKISNTRATTILMSATNNFAQPSMVLPLVKLVQDQSIFSVDKAPYLAAAAYINVARLAHRQCIDPHYRNFTIPYPILGNQQCSRQTILNSYLPWLKQKMTGAQESWQKLIFVRAIDNLACQETMEVLREVVLGKVDRNPLVRITAMDAFTRPKYPAHMRNQVFTLLTPIMESIQEPALVRQHALRILLTWRPDSAFYNRVASLTWNNRVSPDVAAFMTLSLRTMAQTQSPHMYEHDRIISDAKIAKEAYLRAKPAALTYRNSFNAYYNRFWEPKKIGNHINLSWLNSPESQQLSEMYMSIKPYLGGLGFDLFEMEWAGTGVSQELFKLKQSFMNNYKRSSSYRPRMTGEAQKTMDIHKNFMEDVNAVSSEDGLNGYIFINAFDNMKQLFPLNGQALEKVFAGSNILKELLKGERKVLTTKMFNPSPMALFIPTEIGLPIIAKSESAIMLHAEGQSSLVVPGVSDPKFEDVVYAQKLNYTTNVQFRLVTKFSTFVNVLAPWNMKKIGAGVDSEKTLTFPGRFAMGWNRASGEKFLELRAKPEARKFPVVYIKNVPMTIMKPLLPGQQDDPLSSNGVQVLSVDPMRKPAVQWNYQWNADKTGLKGSLRWRADRSLPFTWGNSLDIIRNPTSVYKLMLSPTSFYYDGQIELQQTEQPEVALFFGYTNSQSVKESPKPAPLMAGESPEERAAKVKHAASARGGQLWSVRAAAEFNGQQRRAYEVNWLWRPQQKQGSNEKITLDANFMRTPIPSDQSPYALCMENEIEKPVINTVADLRQVLDSGVKLWMSSKVKSGKDCQSGQQAAQWKASMEVSETRRTALKKQMSESTALDSSNPTLMWPVDAVYDRASLDLTWTQNLPKNVLNMTYWIDDIVRGEMYPFNEYNYLAKQGENRVTIQGTREVKTWDIFAKMHSNTVRARSLYIPYFMTQVVPWFGLQTPEGRAQNYVLPSIDSAHAATCNFEANRIRTFKGKTLEFSPSQAPSACWTTLISAQLTSGWMIFQARSVNGQVEARFVPDTLDSPVVMASWNSLWINGKSHPISSSPVPITSQGSTIGQAKKVGDAIWFEINGRLQTTIEKDLVTLKVSADFSNLASGLCDSVWAGHARDLVGPQKCIYPESKASLLKAAWQTTTGEGCPASELQQTKQKVQQFRQNCKKASPSGLNPSMSSIDMQSMDKVVRVLREGNEVCITQQAVTHCKSGSPSKWHLIEMNLWCWKHGEQPSLVTRDMEQGWIPASEAHQIPTNHASREQKQIRVPTMCQ